MTGCLDSGIFCSDGAQNAPDSAFRSVHSPTDEWTSQQLREATPWGKGPKYLLHDRDSKYASHFSAVATGSGIAELRTPYRAPEAMVFVNVS
jgi:hypothetical protein